MPIMTLELPQEAITQVATSVPDMDRGLINGPESEVDIVKIAEELSTPVSLPQEAVEQNPSACLLIEVLTPGQTSAISKYTIGEVRKSEIRLEAARFVRGIRAQIGTSMRMPVSQAKKSELETAAAIIVAGIRGRMKLAQMGKAEQELPHCSETEITIS